MTIRALPGRNERVEELNELVANSRYGWPYVYAGGKFNQQDEPPPACAQEIRTIKRPARRFSRSGPTERPFPANNGVVITHRLCAVVAASVVEAAEPTGRP